MYVEIGSLDVSVENVSRINILGVSDLALCYLDKTIIQI